MNCSLLCWYKTDVIVTLTFLPSFTYVCLSSSLSLSFFLSFFDRYKTASRVRLYSRRVVSFRLFRSRRFGFALRAFNLFAPLPYSSLCMRTRVCAFASLYALCLCQLLILYKHTHTYASERASERALSLTHTHTHTYRRWWEERHTDEVGGKWKREREREDHCDVVRLINDSGRKSGWRDKRILPFRSIRLTAFSRMIVPRSSGKMISLCYFILSYPWLTISFLFSSSRAYKWHLYVHIGTYIFLSMRVCVWASPETMKMCHASLQWTVDLRRGRASV